jgi:hypothetical protein
MPPQLSRNDAGPKAISLSFAPKIFVAGEVISGHVDLDIGLALEDDIQRVRVKLRGLMTTYVYINENI